MIISHLLGGLGNQMFQFAAGRSLALTAKTDLRLDISDYTHYRLHQGYELDRVFGVSRSLIASTADLRSVLGIRSYKIVRYLLAKRSFRAFRGRDFVVDEQPECHDDYFSEGASRYLFGYWQSEQYFSKVADVVRKDFTFTKLLCGKNDELARLISSSNSVSLHVRRGDYISNAQTAQYHGVCSLDYYYSAVEYMRSRVEEPMFFVFSDDVLWVTENLKIEGHSCYVGHNKGQDSYIDMQLMSLCKHNIIANSSFSWWGAWLNTNLGKIVVAPQCWYAIEKSTSNLLPTTWVRF